MFKIEATFLLYTQFLSIIRQQVPIIPSFLNIYLVGNLAWRAVWQNPVLPVGIVGQEPSSHFDDVDSQGI